jgi:acyl carrier protein
VTAEHDEEIIAGIAAVWRRTLQLSHVGIDDNFFDVGGKSLGVMQVVVALRERFGVELTSVDVLRHSTIRTMARFIGETRESTDVVESREPSTGPSRAPLHALRRRRTSSDDRRD